MEFEKSVLVLTHSDYLHTDAGVEKVIQGQQKFFLENHMNFVAVYPLRKDTKILGMVHSSTLPGYGLIVNGKHQGEITESEFQNLLNLKGLCSVIIHELVTFRKNEKLFQFFDRISCPVYYFVHDYAMICYNHILMRNNRQFCGTEPLSFKKCKNCRFYLEGKFNERWQKKFVERYPKITYLFPSAVVQEIWQKTFHVKNPQRIVPNTKFSGGEKGYQRKAESERLRIAFVGYGRVEKGWETWKKICGKYGDLYDLYILGDAEPLEKVKKVPVSVAKDGPDAMIRALREHQIDIAFLWSEVPETYSYTFFEAYVSGCFVLTNERSGNICAMTRKYECGKVFQEEESLFSYLKNACLVRESVERMYEQKEKHPVGLENNDEILSIVKGTER